MMAGRYEVRDPEIELLLKDLGRRLTSSMPRGFGFTLMIFSYGAGGSMFYISSAERLDMLAAMREFLAKEAEKS